MLFEGRLTKGGGKSIFAHYIFYISYVILVGTARQRSWHQSHSPQTIPFRR